MNRKVLFFGMICLISSLYLIHGEEVIWLTNAPQATKKARDEDKPLIIFFTGSDWCPWCKKLDQEVFEQQEFKSYANKNLVLLLADYPHQTPQDETLKTQNIGLQRRYSIIKFPTVIVLNPQGDILGGLGYIPGGTNKWISALDNITHRKLVPFQN